MIGWKELRKIITLSNAVQVGRLCGSICKQLLTKDKDSVDLKGLEFLENDNQGNGINAFNIMKYHNFSKKVVTIVGTKSINFSDFGCCLQVHSVH